MGGDQGRGWRILWGGDPGGGVQPQGLLHLMGGRHHPGEEGVECKSNSNRGTLLPSIQPPGWQVPPRSLQAAGAQEVMQAEQGGGELGVVVVLGQGHLPVPGQGGAGTHWPGLTCWN